MFWNLWTEDYMSSTFTFLTKKILMWYLKSLKEYRGIIAPFCNHCFPKNKSKPLELAFSTRFSFHIHIYIYLNSEIIFHGKNGWRCDGNIHIYHFLIAKISYFLTKWCTTQIFIRLYCFGNTKRNILIRRSNDEKS